MATPFHRPSPWCASSYPASWNASAGASGSASLVSCISSTSGRARSSHHVTLSRRAFSELTFQVAILTSPLTPRSPRGPYLSRRMEAALAQDAHGSEKLLQRVGRFLGPFLQHPVSGVLQYSDGHIRGDKLRLLTQYVSEGLLAADHEEWHRQLRLR